MLREVTAQGFAREKVKTKGMDVSLGCTIAPALPAAKGVVNTRKSSCRLISRLSYGPLHAHLYIVLLPRDVTFDIQDQRPKTNRESPGCSESEQVMSNPSSKAALRDAPLTNH